MSQLSQQLFHFDKKIFIVINQSFHCTVLNIFMSKITHLGGTIFSAGLSLYLIFFAENRHLALFFTKSLLITTLLSLLLKAFYNRIRPNIAVKSAKTFNIPLYTYSFPSGHTTAAFTSATVYSLFFPFLAPLFFLLAIIVGFSRIYLGVHYPTDVLAGSILGLLTTFFLFIL